MLNNNVDALYNTLDKPTSVHEASLVSKTKEVDEELILDTITQTGLKTTEDVVARMVELNNFEERLKELEKKLSSQYSFPDYSKRITGKDELATLPRNTWLIIHRPGQYSGCDVTIGGTYIGYIGRNGGGYWEDSISTFPIPANVTFHIDNNVRCNIFRFECL